jgi:hypothetical protein
MQKKVILIRMDWEQMSGLRRIAARRSIEAGRNISMASLVREAVDEWLAKKKT